MKRAHIDWTEVRNRLKASERALERVLSPDQRRIEEVYARRAVELARTSTDRSVARGVPALFFRLAQERYAIELTDLAEVLPYARCVPAPGSPPQFLGVMNVRGELLAVADGRRILAPGAGADSESGFVLVLRRAGHEVGLKVDEVDELREIRREELAQSGNSRFAQGIMDGAVTLLKVDAVLASIFARGSV